MVFPTNSLDSYFQSVIQSVLYYEAQPLDRMTESKSDYSQLRGVYLDLDTKLESLQNSGFR